MSRSSRTKEKMASGAAADLGEPVAQEAAEPKAKEPTVKALKAEAKELKVAGYNKMNKDDLVVAIAKAKKKPAKAKTPAKKETAPDVEEPTGRRKVTFNMDEDLYREMKVRVAMEGKKTGIFIEEAVRGALAAQK